MNYDEIYQAVIDAGGTDTEAALAVSIAFDAEEKRKADEEAEAMLEHENGG